MSLINDPYASATVLNMLCLKMWGSEYLNWEPSLIREELSEDVPEINKEKIIALSTLLSTNQFYTYWEPFECIANCLNNELPQFEDITPLTPKNMCWAIVEAAINDEDGEEYSGEVIEYMKTVLKNVGATEIPKEFDFIGYKAPANLDPDFVDDIDRYIKKRKKRIENEVSIAFGNNIEINL